MKKLRVPLDELSQSRLMIQGFNRDGQRAFGKVKLELFIDNMESNALFHVIDAKTTYNMLGGHGYIRMVWFLQHSINASNIAKMVK